MKVLKTRFVSGFTLIELLVVIAIIGLLSSVVLTALNHTRQSSRDAKRLTDVKQIKTGMDVYFASGNGYPPTSVFNTAVSTGVPISCDGEVVVRVVQDPIYPNYAYTYTAPAGTISGCGRSDLTDNYTLTFVLEATGTTYTMNEDGEITPPIPNQ